MTTTALNSKITVYPDLIDLNEPHQRELVVSFGVTPKQIVEVLFKLSHKIEDAGLEVALPQINSLTRRASGLLWQIDLGTEASHELSVLLLMTAARFIENHDAYAGSVDVYMVDASATTYTPSKPELPDVAASTAVTLVSSSSDEPHADLQMPSDEPHTDGQTSSDEPHADLQTPLLSAITAEGRIKAQKHRLLELIESIHVDAAASDWWSGVLPTFVALSEATRLYLNVWEDEFESRVEHELDPVFQVRTTDLLPARTRLAQVARLVANAQITLGLDERGDVLGDHSPARIVEVVLTAFGFGET